jgi:3-oxoacyl-[acyl-carrier protein] reductase
MLTAALYAATIKKKGGAAVKTALIVGGSRGIGEAMVRLFCARGHRVMFTYHKSENEALQLSKETGALSFPADVREEENIDLLKQAALRQLIHLDALILNTGIAWMGLLSEMPVSAWDDLQNTNVRGAFLVLKDLLPIMRQRGGAVLLMSSMWGKRGASCEAAYSASKAALIGLAQALAREEGPGGIRVNALCPGVISTDMLDGYTHDELIALKQATPLCHLGTPDDVARAAFFLCGEDAAFITGQALNVDGGYL